MAQGAEEEERSMSRKRWRAASGRPWRREAEMAVFQVTVSRAGRRWNSLRVRSKGWDLAAEEKKRLVWKARGVLWDDGKELGLRWETVVGEGR